MAAMVVHGCTALRQRIGRLDRPAGVVVGCGSGDEVVYLRHMLRSDRVVGVDMLPAFSNAARRESCVAMGDAQSLPLESEAFDFAAAFHSLEHVGDPRRALGEIWRVLRPGAWFYVGVPNKSRLVGYLGSFDATTWQKITWNLTDWKARLLGRFDNELGAHAGFGRLELVQLLEERFTNVQLLTEEFVRFKYAGRLPKRVLDLLLAPKILDYAVPAHYALCQKPR
ncbi:MAG: methyltransferase domain-containing protein [Acidobacteriia bacterium]|nr:methyltransferase domain-containing protein [Terriglobia bacterium]